MCAQSCLTPCNPMDCSLSGCSAHAIFQARILEWLSISYSRGSSPSRGQTHVSYVSCIVRQILYHCATQEALLTSVYVGNFFKVSIDKYE